MRPRSSPRWRTAAVFAAVVAAMPAGCNGILGTPDPVLAVDAAGGAEGGSEAAGPEVGADTAASAEGAPDSAVAVETGTDAAPVDAPPGDVAGGDGGDAGSPWLVRLVAGDGTAGFAGDNGSATKAELGYYVSTAVADAAGNLYVADASNARIRKVDASGTITTYAGTGTPGDSGDNGPALQAQINAPSGMTVDPAGNLYFADYNAKAIRKIDPSQVITTYASLPSQPTSLAIDKSGNLYVALYSKDEIVKVDSQQHLTVVAGNGSSGYTGDHGPATSATLSNPNGVWMDTDGSLYIVDADNYVIRRVDSGGTITTFAGTGSPGFTGDQGPATSAEMQPAFGVVADGHGNVYFADGLNNRIRCVDPGGTIRTVAGDGSSALTTGPVAALSAGLTQPSYTSLDAAGHIYFSAQTAVIYELYP